MRFRHDIHFQFEVLKRLGIPDVKQMAAFAASDESAVFDLPGAGMFRGLLPAIKRLSIKDRDEARFIGGVQLQRDRGQHGQTSEEERFHAVDANHLPWIRQADLCARFRPAWLDSERIVSAGTLNATAPKARASEPGLRTAPLGRRCAPPWGQLA